MENTLKINQKRQEIWNSIQNRYLKNKVKILSSENSTEKNRKRTTGPENPDVEDCVFKCFKQSRDKNIPIGSPIMTAKAEKFATAFGIQDFRACTGWLNGFNIEIIFLTKQFVVKLVQ